jgi:hypothetical protein
MLVAGGAVIAVGFYQSLSDPDSPAWGALGFALFMAGYVGFQYIRQAFRRLFPAWSLSPQWRSRCKKWALAALASFAAVFIVAQAITLLVVAMKLVQDPQFFIDMVDWGSAVRFWAILLGVNVLIRLPAWVDKLRHR